MEENKNLNPEENTSPECEDVNASEEVTEEITEEVTESVAAEEKEASDDVSFAEVGTDSDDENVPAPKKKKTGIFIAIAALIVIIAAAIFVFGTSRPSEGTGNLLCQGFATSKGNDVYHVDFEDLKLHRTNLKTNETEVLSDDFALYISNYNNNIYYFAYKEAEDGDDFTYEYRKFVDGKNDEVILADSIASPQLANGYLYYLKSVPEFHSGYSSRLYRVSLSGGEPEAVCDALMVSYLVDGDDLYYCDAESASLLKVSLKKTMQVIKDAPLGEGEKRSTTDFEPETITQAVVTCMAKSGKTLYFIDAQTGNYTLYTYDVKSGSVGEVNNGVNAATINIYGKFLYYYSTTDFSIYRMNLDGSDVMKITEPCYGYMVLSGDKFMSMSFTDNYKQYIEVCDLDGNTLYEIGLSDDDEDDLYEDVNASDDEIDEDADDVSEDAEDIAEDAEAPEADGETDED